MSLFALLQACFWLSEKPPRPCPEPHLWYAQDDSGDVYFGCTPPSGWQRTPPDEILFATPPESTADPVAVMSADVDTGIGSTSDPTPRIDTSAPPLDTSLPFPKNDDLPEDEPERGGAEDTGFEEDEDTGFEGDTGVEEDEDVGPEGEDTGIEEDDTGFEEDEDTGAEEGEGGEDTGVEEGEEGEGGEDTGEVPPPDPVGEPVLGPDTGDTGGA